VAATAVDVRLANDRVGVGGLARDANVMGELDRGSRCFRPLRWRTHPPDCAYPAKAAEPPLAVNQYSDAFARIHSRPRMTSGSVSSG
jgi:hypothetical protein